MPNTNEKETAARSKSGFAAIIGRPNVGKSSLLNALLGEKLAIVTAKPQTTRNRITGVLTEENTQLVFIDTPGMHIPKTKLGEYMVKQVNDSVSDVDIVVMVVEPNPVPTEIEKSLAEKLASSHIPVILVINKIDTLKNRDELLPVVEAYRGLCDFTEVYPVSAQSKEGLRALRKDLLGRAKPGPHFFPEDSYTDQPERVIAAEIIREKILLTMFDEIPHGVFVEIEKMRERENGDIMDMSAVIYCEKDSHKGMIIGKGGSMLKKIGSLSRTDLEEFLGIRINLKLWVKVSEDWRNKERQIRSFGYQ